MALNFPSNPSLNDTYTSGNQTYTWDGSKWYIFGQNNAETLDALNSTQFLRSDDSDIKTAGDLIFNNNVKAAFGTNSNMEIWHSGNDGNISNDTGNITVRTAQTIDFLTTGFERTARFNANSSVDLYHNNILRLSTTSDGIDVVGNIELQSAGPVLFLNETDATADNRIIALGMSGGEFTLQFRTDALSGGGDFAKFPRSNNQMLGMEFLNSGIVKNFISNSGNSYFTSGNVGIGTTSPRAPLHVWPTGVASDDINLMVSQFRPNIVLEDLSTSAVDWQFFVDGDALQFRYGDASTDTKLVSEAARLTSTGLNVDGNVTLTGTVDGRDVAADGTKLDGIEAGATADQTASEILTAVKTVDGTGSGLDADLLDGQHGSYYLDYNNFTNTPTVGDITAVTAGTGLSGGGTSGSVTLSIQSDLRGEVQYIGQSTSDYYYISTSTHNWYINGGFEMHLQSTGDLHVEGDVIAYSTTTSDERLKTDIQKVENALDKIIQLNGYTFTYTTDDRKSAGVIAQEVEKILPSAVRETTLPVKTGDEETLYKTVQYDQLHALTIEAIKEIKQDLDKIKEKIGM